MNDKVSIIYYQKNDSPKYFEIKTNLLYWLLIGIPSLAIFFFCLNLFGFFNLASKKLFESNQNFKTSLQHPNIKQELGDWQNKFLSLSTENERLRQEIENQKNMINNFKSSSSANVTSPPLVESTETVVKSNLPTPVNRHGQIFQINPGFEQLMLFNVSPQFKDRTRPAQLNLSGFNLIETSSTLNFQFNIIPNRIDENKISGYIVVLMKNSSGIFAYPELALSGSQIKIHINRGEPFLTQRFRPVSASFLKPKKFKQNNFLIYIFDRNEDLIHFQTVTLP